MLHARIAARAFNTPLLIDPSKAMAFLSGLGPRILGRKLEIADIAGPLPFRDAATLPAQTSVLASSLATRQDLHGDTPFPVIDGIAVIEISGVLIHRGSWIGQSSGQTSYEGIAAQIDAAANDTAVHGLALEIDSFGGEVAGVFDLADRIRAIRTKKPVWAFVAEHAFSAGYALASQADRILLPRTGSVGSIGVVVMHADLSGQLDQDGVRVTLVHSGRHKVDANPYQPLPDAAEADIQREIDALRLLFAETVAAGRSTRLDREAALATEAAIYRGMEAVRAGLADEVTDLSQGFSKFRKMIAHPPPLPLLRPSQASLPQPKQEAKMADENDPEDCPQDTPPNVPDPGQCEPKPPAEASPAQSLASQPPAAATVATSGVSALHASNLADLSQQVREAAAEIADIAAMAGRLGIAIDAAKALREGTQPEALRKLVLERAAAAADARDIIAAPPSVVLPKSAESPIVAAAKKAAAGAKA